MYQRTVGLHEDILTQTGDGDRIARRTTVNTRSQVQAENLEVIGRWMVDHRREREKCSRKSWWHGGEDGQVKERANADVASSMQIKNINGMISLMTSSSGNRPRSEEAPQPRNHIAKRCSMFTKVGVHRADEQGSEKCTFGNGYGRGCGAPLRWRSAGREAK